MIPKIYSYIFQAGIVCKLNTRCTIIAATNPKGNLNSLQSLAMNISLPSPLLSRFDLVLILRDRIDDHWDELLADYILGYSKNIKTDNEVIWTIDILQVTYATTFIYEINDVTYYLEYNNVLIL